MNQIIKPASGLVKQVSIEEFLGMIQQESRLNTVRTAELSIRLGALQNALVTKGVILEADVESELKKINDEIEKSMAAVQGNAPTTTPEKPKSSLILP